MAGTPPQTQVHQGSGGGTGASPGFDWAKGFFSSLPGVFSGQYPSQYPGQLDPGLSPTMQQVIRQAQGYASQGPSSTLQGIQGSLGSFMSPNFINPQLRAGQGYPDYYHTDPNAPTYGGGTVGQLPGFNPMTGQGGMDSMQAAMRASMGGSPGNGIGSPSPGGGFGQSAAGGPAGGIMEPGGGGMPWGGASGLPPSMAPAGGAYPNQPAPGQQPGAGGMQSSFNPAPGSGGSGMPASGPGSLASYLPGGGPPSMPPAGWGSPGGPAPGGGEQMANELGSQANFGGGRQPMLPGQSPSADPFQQFLARLRQRQANHPGMPGGPHGIAIPNRNGPMPPNIYPTHFGVPGGGDGRPTPMPDPLQALHSILSGPGGGQSGGPVTAISPSMWIPGTGNGPGWKTPGPQTPGGQPPGVTMQRQPWTQQGPQG